MSADPRSRAQRRRDTAPHLVPLSSDWDGEALLVAAPTNRPLLKGSDEYENNDM
jgi:hypothetical protein